MTYRFDLNNPSQTSTLIALSMTDVNFDVGRKWTYVPSEKQFVLNFADEVRTIAELRDDEQVRFYLQTEGQNPTAKTSFANLIYEPILHEEILGLAEAK
ncbi:hypothetical protein ESZ50_01710 [Weissella muntiaci]|jgi:hypothetical protein|uniref:Uncharacterized protein n=1 Tax=Weissella muntiaci TaxID=2508881 RepID=A0A6C2C9J0_9LACO|nr:hypothetical protein [Weissella muntiaci]TYC50678.1 hypothetical protein ESZ50_01710 [Weissella muntiaci]